MRQASRFDGCPTAAMTRRGLDRRRIGFAGAVAAGVFALVVVADATSTVQAAECLLEPNLQKPGGGRWFYRTDRVTNRKCWYQKEEGVAPQAAAPQPNDAPRAAAPPAPPPETPPMRASRAASPNDTIGARASRSEAQPLTKTARDELFEQFLQWRRHQP